MDGGSNHAGLGLLKTRPSRRRLRPSGHDPAYWPYLVRELEASYQAVVLANTAPRLGVRLLWLRSEGLSWAECLEALRRQSLP